VKQEEIKTVENRDTAVLERPCIPLVRLEDILGLTGKNGDLAHDNRLVLESQGKTDWFYRQ